MLSGDVIYALQLERAGVVFAIEEKNMSMLGEQYTVRTLCCLFACISVWESYERSNTNIFV